MDHVRQYIFVSIRLAYLIISMSKRNAHQYDFMPYTSASPLCLALSRLLRYIHVTAHNGIEIRILVHLNWPVSLLMWPNRRQTYLVRRVEMNARTIRFVAPFIAKVFIQMANIICYVFVICI